MNRRWSDPANTLVNAWKILETDNIVTFRRGDIVQKSSQSDVRDALRLESMILLWTEIMRANHLEHSLCSFRPLRFGTVPGVEDEDRVSVLDIICRILSLRKRFELFDDISAICLVVSKVTDASGWDT